MLDVLAENGSDSEKRQARAIRKLVRRHRHHLLVTLLLMNCLAAEALPIFLNQLVPSSVAILIGVTVILLLGEIIPHAICARFPLVLGWLTFYPVACLMIITCPIACPLGALLDCCLGGDHRRYFERKELEGLVAMHARPKNDDECDPFDPHHAGNLHSTEIRVIQHAMDLGLKTTEEVMTSLDKCFVVAVNETLSKKSIERILETGFSRVPVYVPPDKRNLCGVLCVRSLVLIPDGARVIGDLTLGHLPAMDSGASIWRLLHAFQQCHCHIAAVVSDDHHKQVISHLRDQESIGIPDCWDRPFGKVIGIATLHDVVNELEIVHGEIEDLVDVHIPPDLVPGVNKTMEPPRSPFPFPFDDPFHPSLTPTTVESVDSCLTVEVGDPRRLLQIADALGHSCEDCGQVFPSSVAIEKHECKKDIPE